MTDPSPRQGTTSKAAAAGASPAPTGDDVLSVLAEFEAGLESLKQLYVQRQALSEELKRRADQMQAAEADFQTRKDELASREREIMQGSAALGERWRLLEARETQLCADLAALEQRLAAASAKEAEAAAREKSAQDSLRSAEQGIAQLEAHEVDLKARAQRHDELAKALEQRSAELEVKARAADEARAQARAEQDAVGTARAELENQTAEAARTKASLEALEAELARKKTELERDRAALEAKAQELERSSVNASAAATAAREAQAQAESAKARLEDAERRLAAQAESMEVLKGEHAKAAEALKTQAATLQRRLDEAHAALEAASLRAQEKESAQGAEIQSRLNAALAAADEALKHRDQARAEAQAAREHLASAAASADERISQLSKEIDAQKQAIATAAATGEAAMQDAALSGQLSAALTCCAEVFAEYEALWKHEVAEHLRTRQHLAEAEEKLTHVPPQGKASGDKSEVDAQAEALADRLRKACEALVQLRDERTELTQKVTWLESEVERSRKLLAQANAGATGRAAHPTALKRRRERLNLCRELSRQRAQKIKRAESALSTRFEQCERVLSMRQELAEARELITAAQRKTERQRAGGKTAALLFYGSAAAAFLGVLSWFGTQQAIPATYAAHAIIAADARGKTLGPGEYTEWQTFHENLVSDPRFIEVAAERMQRRGITELGRPADLAAECKKHLDTQSAAAGELNLEWRGEGAERTQRILDTFVTALASQANAARERRVDGAVTQIRQIATAGSERLDTDYRWIAACVWGASLILTFGFAALFWRRLSNAKATFEGSATVDAALDTRRWNLPMRK